MLAVIFWCICLLLLILGLSLVIYARWNYGKLEAMGLPVETPHWFMGNMANHDNVYHHWVDLERTKKLGLIYGIYEGRTPIVHCADPAVIYKMLFTESEYFDKRVQDFGDATANEMIEFLTGEKWKIVRNILSPQFTTGKLKMQSHIVQNISTSYVEHLKSLKDENGRVSKVDVHEFIAPYVIEVIAEMLCGLKLTDAKNPENSFVKSMRTTLFDNFKMGPEFKYVLAFPFLAKFAPSTQPEAMQYLKNYLTDIMDERERSKNPNPDMVSVLVEMRRRVKTEPEYKRLGISNETVFAQAFEFFLASFLGVTVHTKMLLYFFVNNPAVYEKASREVETVLKKFNGEISYDSTGEMEYLSACINEVLRIAPGFFRVDRVCVKDWAHEGIRLPKGTIVQFPLYALHHNPDAHPEPKKFDPERFMPENKDRLVPCSFLTFGQGQRQCLGMRLAHQVMKIFIASILNEFRLEKRGDTVLKEYPGNSFFVQMDPIYLDFVQKKPGPKK